MTQLRVTKAAGKGTLRLSIARSIGFSGIARFSGALGQALDVERVLAAWDHLYCYGAVFWVWDFTLEPDPRTEELILVDPSMEFGSVVGGNRGMAVYQDCE